MSPLWPDLAIARAALEDAVDKGLIDARAARELPRPANDTGRLGPAVRRPIRRRVSSYAL